MKVSYRWLGRHVDLEGISPQELGQGLSLHAAEVEGLEPFAPVLSEVVVGHVVERQPHPNADRLSVCKVDLGSAGPGELVQIVCGAPNVGEGQRVAVARVGTRLSEDLKVKKGKIRGEVSLGMICSQLELGLGEDHTGIWVLDEASPVGVPVAEALGVEDVVLEIDNKSLTHRPDCWGHRGLAREVAAIFRRELKPLDLSLPATGDGGSWPVRVDTPGCPRYLGLCIDGVRNEESPLWLKLLLVAAGQRPRDLLVDLSNFVMLDLGQPSHLFDRRRLDEQGIRVRDARSGERMTTLDGVERALVEEDMLICSGDDPVAIAGVMGGEATKVDADTTALLLEAASFHPARVRRTAARLGLRTDASARFEKNLDPTLPAQAAAHLVRLLQEIQPQVTLPAPAGEGGDWEDPAGSVSLRPARARTVLGVDLDDDTIAGHLERLGLQVTRGEPAWSVAVPSARATKDLRIEEDLIEEVGRMEGYSAIEARPLRGDILPPAREHQRQLVRSLQDRLAGAARFHEVQTYSFLPEEVAQVFGVEDEPYVEAVNPVLESWGRIRRGVMPSVLALLEDNLRRRETVRLFELGKGYLPEDPSDRGEPREVQELALVLARPRPGRDARFDAGAFAELQGVVEDLLASSDRALPRWDRAEEADGWGHPGRALIGRLGDDGPPAVLLAELEPGLARRLGAGVAGSDVACALVSVDRLVSQTGGGAAFRPIPRFPGIKVDVALAVPEDLPAEDCQAAIEGAGKGLVTQVELFDLYRGEALGSGKKSLAYHVVLQAPDKTLSDKQERKFLERLEQAIAQAGGELRRE